MSVSRNCKCVYMSRRSWFYVCMFFYIYTVECMSECVYVFMYLCIYMFAIRWEREIERGGRLVPEEQFNCLQECCYLSPRSNNIISSTRILTFSVAKLCPIKHWQAKCHKRRRQVFDVLSMLCWKLNFLHLSSYHIKNYQDFLRKKKFMLFVF